MPSTAAHLDAFSLFPAAPDAGGGEMHRSLVALVNFQLLGVSLLSSPGSDSLFEKAIRFGLGLVQAVAIGRTSGPVSNPLNFLDMADTWLPPSPPAGGGLGAVVVTMGVTIRRETCLLFTGSRAVMTIKASAPSRLLDEPTARTLPCGVEDSLSVSESRDVIVDTLGMGAKSTCRFDGSSSPLPSPSVKLERGLLSLNVGTGIRPP
mmetsp:Transcript_5177/g.11458  ORF Transcript_5177/g.11458 Transcript_5177/m.11458 type:complete len:206 (-) Transcript_5177:670-1287(-)